MASRYQVFSDDEFLRPPVKRAAYSDRTALLMAEMSKLAYFPFERADDSGDGGIYEALIESIKATVSTSEARSLLDDFVAQTAGVTEGKGAVQLAETLGPHHAALLRAHGAVITAESIPALLIDTVHFEENAKALYDATQLGKVKPMSKAEMDRFHDLFERDKHVVKLWRYYLSRGLESGTLPAEWGKILFPSERV